MQQIKQSERRRKEKTKTFEALRACAAGFEGNLCWTALINTWLYVWLTLPNVQFGSAVPFTRHIRTTMLGLQEKQWGPFEDKACTRTAELSPKVI